MRQLVVWVVFSLLLVTASWAYSDPPRVTQGGEELTLARAVDIALSANPLVRVAASGQDLAVAQLREAQAGWLPTVKAGETVTRSNNAVFVFGSLLEQRQFGAANFAISALNDPDPVTNWRSYIAVQLPVFSRLQTVTKVAQSRLGLQQAQAQRDGTAQRVCFEVIRAYYGVLVAEAARDVTDEAVHMAEANLKRMRDRFETGAVVEADLLSMQVQLAQFRQRKIQSGGNVIVAYAALNTAMGLPITTVNRIAHPAMDRSFTLADEGDLMAAALTNRADYRQSQMDVEIKRHGTIAAKGQYLPELNLFASAGNSAQNFGTSGSDYAIGATLSLTLFDAGRPARVRQARALHEIANAQQDHQADQIRVEVVQAVQQYRVAQESVKVAAESAKQADEALRMIRDRYDGGLTTITEVLRAQTAQQQAKIGLLSARYDYFVGYASVLLATGGLNDVRAFSDQ